MRQAILALGLLLLFGAAAQAGDDVEHTPSAMTAVRGLGYELQMAAMANLTRAVTAELTDVKPFRQNAEATLAWSKVIPWLFP